MTLVARPYDLPISPQDLRAPGRLGMMLLIATEASFFVYLLFSYFYLASMARGSWPPDGNPALRLSLPNTIILIVSSGTMWWAEAGIKRGQQGRLRLGLLVTLLLGLLFLALQGLEYSHQKFTPATHAYGSLFFTILSLHALHVIGAILIVAWLEIRSFAGHFNREHHAAVQTGALYWHFVDVVWIAIFSILYVSPRF